MIPAADLEQLFDGSFAQLFQKEALQLIVKCSSEADTIRNSYGLHKEVAKWHLPFGRRAIIETQLFELAGRYGLQAEFKHTRGGKNPYLAITAGNFILTESKVDEPSQLPREADFRTQNALLNYSLFAEFEDASQDNRIYVILAYVPSFEEPCPEHVEFLFPDADYSRVLHSIDLLNRFAKPKSKDSGDETPAVDPTPKLRKKADDRGEVQA